MCLLSCNLNAVFDRLSVPREFSRIIIVSSVPLGRTTSKRFMTVGSWVRMSVQSHSSFSLSDTANTGYLLDEKLVPKGTAGAVKITEGAASVKGKVTLSGICWGR